MEQGDEAGLAVVDRIEGEVAVLEFLNRPHRIEVPVRLLSRESREGMVVEVSFRHRPDVERERREALEAHQYKLIESA